MMKRLFFLGIMVCCGISGVSGKSLVDGHEIVPNDERRSSLDELAEHSFGDSSNGDVVEINGEQQQWIESHRELIDLAQTSGSAFDELIDALTNEGKVSLYDYISRVCWNGVGRFGASHDDTEFYAIYECQQYID